MGGSIQIFVFYYIYTNVSTFSDRYFSFSHSSTFRSCQLAPVESNNRHVCADTALVYILLCTLCTSPCPALLSCRAVTWLSGAESCTVLLQSPIMAESDQSAVWCYFTLQITMSVKMWYAVSGNTTDRVFKKLRQSATSNKRRGEILLYMWVIYLELKNIPQSCETKIYFLSHK